MVHEPTIYIWYIQSTRLQHHHDYHLVSYIQISQTSNRVFAIFSLAIFCSSIVGFAHRDPLHLSFFVLWNQNCFSLLEFGAGRFLTTNDEATGAFIVLAAFTTVIADVR